MPMIPSSLPVDATAGEMRLYRLFEKLPVSFTGWLNPSLDGVTADLVLYTPKNGLIVLEVKDWALDQVVSADRQTVQFRKGWDVESRSCPYGQSQMYLNRLKSMFQRPGGGGFILPLQCGVVFPNIRRDDFEARLRRDSLIADLTDPLTTFFADDIERLEKSPDKGATLQCFLDSHFPSRFSYEHSVNLVKAAKSRLGQAAVLELPVSDWKSGEMRLVTLDEEQEKEALSLSCGRRLLRGPAGSGKTLILVRRAEELWRKGQCKKILFLCFNYSFANYIRRMLSNKAVPLGKQAGVEVVQIFDMLSRILDDRIEETGNNSYYDDVLTLALEALREGHPMRSSWDAIMVDEAQDFSPAMIEAVELLLKPGGPLLAVMDSEQHLYANTSPEAWLALPGMKAVTLKSRYRSTRQIMAFAEDWLDSETYVSDGQLGEVEGEMPRVIQATSSEEAARMAAARISEMRKQGMPQGRMAVLYAKSGQNLPRLIRKALSLQGHMWIWPVEDSRAKRRYDITTDSVTVSTIHSMKGMDFAHVTLVLPRSMAGGREKSLLKRLEERRAAWEKRRKSPTAEISDRFRPLIYVGMTRARQSLTVIWYDERK